MKLSEVINEKSGRLVSTKEICSKLVCNDYLAGLRCIDIVIDRIDADKLMEKIDEYLSGISYKTLLVFGCLHVLNMSAREVTEQTGVKISVTNMPKYNIETQTKVLEDRRHS